MTRNLLLAAAAVLFTVAAAEVTFRAVGFDFSFTGVQSVPAPGTVVLLAIGLIGVAARSAAVKPAPPAA